MLEQVQEVICYKIFVFSHPKERDVSSVGLEHRLDRAGVTGSNPVHPTIGCGFGCEGSVGVQLT